MPGHSVPDRNKFIPPRLGNVKKKLGFISCGFPNFWRTRRNATRMRTNGRTTSRSSARGRNRSFWRARNRNFLRELEPNSAERRTSNGNWSRIWGWNRKARSTSSPTGTLTGPTTSPSFATAGNRNMTYRKNGMPARKPSRMTRRGAPRNSGLRIGLDRF